MALTTEQRATLIVRVANNRKAAKSYLRSLTGDGSAAALKEELSVAEADPAAVRLAAQMQAERDHDRRTVQQEVVDSGAALMLQRLKTAVAEDGRTQDAIASAAGISQSLLGQYLNGHKLPGPINLARIARAVGCVWVLERIDG